MARKVKWLSADRAGAPALSGTKGSIVALLDAVLVSGFNLKTVAAAAAATGVVTLPIGSGHGFVKDDVVLIDGATGSYSALNTEFDIVSVDATSITVSASVPDGAVTGSVTVKFAPFGWEKIFGGTNIGAYRSKNISSSRAVIRVDHSQSEINALVIGYESMQSIDAGVNRFPSASNLGADLYLWPVSSTVGTLARRWEIVGDDRTFYLFVAPRSSNVSPNTAQIGVGFGDAEDWRPGSVFSAWISGGKGAITNDDYSIYKFAAPIYTSFKNYLQRDYTGVTPSVLAGATLPGTLVSDGAIGRSQAPDSVASRVDGSVISAPVLILESGNLIRGKYRGLYWPYVGGQGATDYLISPTVGDAAGRMLLVSGDSTFGNFCCLFDLKGTW